MLDKKQHPKKKTKYPPPRAWALALRWGGTIISSLLFLWLILRQNWDVVLEKAGGIAPWAMVLAVVFYLLSYWFNTLRWCILLWAQGVRLGLWQAYRMNWAGYFASNFLPSTIGGDGLRMVAVHPFTGSKTISIGSVVLDRIINMSAMACLLPAPLIVFGSSLLTIFSVVGNFKPSINPSPISISLVYFSGLIGKYSPKLLSAFQTWSSKPWSFFHAFLAAWPSNLLPIAASYLLARQLGIEVNYWQVMAVQTITYFLAVLPISVNGYGLREVAFTSLYTILGASLEQATTLTLVTRFVMVACTIPGALWLGAAVTENLTLEDGPK